VFVRLGYFWNGEQSSAFSYSKAPVLPQSPPKLSRSLQQRRCPFYSEEMAQALCGRENENFAMRRPKMWKTPYQRLSRSHFLYVKKRSYFSCKVLGRHFRIAKGTCLRILHHTDSMEKFHLRWVSHTLDTNQKVERVILSHGVLSVLPRVRSTGFQSVITGDES
jgi:hypothetical protein